MRLNLYLRGIDLVDVELHAGSRGLYVNVSVFQPRDDVPSSPKPAEHTADLSGTPSVVLERATGPTWGDDQPAVVRLGFQGSS